MNRARRMYEWKVSMRAASTFAESVSAFHSVPTVLAYTTMSTHAQNEDNIQNSPSNRLFGLHFVCERFWVFTQPVLLQSPQKIPSAR